MTKKMHGCGWMSLIIYLRFNLPVTPGWDLQLPRPAWCHCECAEQQVSAQWRVLSFQLLFNRLSTVSEYDITEHIQFLE